MTFVSGNAASPIPPVSRPVPTPPPSSTSIKKYTVYGSGPATPRVVTTVPVHKKVDNNGFGKPARVLSDDEQIVADAQRAASEATKKYGPVGLPNAQTFAHTARGGAIPQVKVNGQPRKAKNK